MTDRLQLCLITNHQSPEKGGDGESMDTTPCPNNHLLKMWMNMHVFAQNS